MQQVVPCLVCGLIVGCFMWATDTTPPLDATSPHPQDSYYNLLVQGFSEGHLYVKRDPPAALAEMPNPYDPVASAPYLLSFNDLSYYKGRLYLYFGITPALVLFWPWYFLTGQYLSEGAAVAIFFAIGLAGAVGLARAICRRYFPESNAWIVTAAMLILGLAMGLAISDTVYAQTGLTISGSVYEIAETCGFAFVMLALVAIWCSIHAGPIRQAFWLIAASFAYGLAIGSRPSLLFGAIVLLVPAIRAWLERAGLGSYSRVMILFAAAVVPIMLAGVGLMLYNDLRFGNPLEFGWHYQLNRNDQAAARQFSLSYLWFDFWFYFLQPFGLTAHFPFLKSIPLPAVPSGHYAYLTSGCGAILTKFPLVLLAVAAPLAWKGRPVQTVSSLRWFAVALLSLFIAVSLTVCLFFATSNRYELDFLPELLLLSVIGFLCLERIVLPHRREVFFVRSGWCLLLMYSLLFNLFLNIETHAIVDCTEGKIFSLHDRFKDALDKYQKAGAIWPDCVEAHFGLASTLAELGRPSDAIAEFQKTLEIAPDYAPACESLGISYLKTGRADDAAVELQKAVELQPKSAEFRSALAFCLFQMGHKDDAVGQYQKAAELDPAKAAYHIFLGGALEADGRLDEAIVQYEKAIELRPDAVQAYNSLGNAFQRQGQTAKAIQQWKLALQYMPESTSAQVNLAWVMATCPDSSLRDGSAAVALAEHANEYCKGQNPAVLRSLAAALAETGRYADAIAAARQALQLFQSDPSQAAAMEEQLKHYQNRQPYRDQTLVK